jgi:hypothetical protein
MPRVNLAGAAAKTRRVQRASPAVARRVLLTHAEVFVRSINLTSPRDTRRYVRGWQMAGRDLGVWATVEGVRPSARRELHLDRLQSQVERIENIIATLEKDAAEKRRLVALWFTSKGRKISQGGRRMLRQAKEREREIERLYSDLERAERELAKLVGNEASIVFWGRRGRAASVNPDGTRVRRRRRRLHTVRDKIYGGRGVIVVGANGRAVMSLHNREAHARLVEARYEPVRKARAAAQGVAQTRMIGRAALKELKGAVGGVMAGRL